MCIRIAAVVFSLVLAAGSANAVRVEDMPTGLRVREIEGGHGLEILSGNMHSLRPRPRDYGR